MEYSARGSRRFVKKKKRPQEDHGLASSPSHPRRCHHPRRRHHHHAGCFRRPLTPRSTPPSSPRSSPPSPPARFFAPVLYRPLATPPPWLGFWAGLRRCVSGGPRNFL
ncbi:hypothetical protein ACQJBY_062640 [Aegilops geniculata]